MKNDVVPVQIRGILPANSGCALFVGNDEKVFVINVEPQMGQIIGMFLRDAPKERPLILQQQNEIARKIVEIDARPSDCLALASAQKRPIFVTQSLFDQVEDMSEVLDKINESGNEPE